MKEKFQTDQKKGIDEGKHAKEKKDEVVKIKNSGNKFRVISFVENFSFDFSETLLIVDLLHCVGICDASDFRKCGDEEAIHNQ